MEIIKEDYHRIDSKEGIYDMTVWFRNILIDIILDGKFPYLIKVEVLKNSLRDIK